MAIREGRWDCPGCGSTAIYGRHVECPGCGKPRPAGVRFYLTGDAPVVTDPEQLREARAGPDWACQHCGASNRATEDDCLGCGAARGSSPRQPAREYGLAEVPRSGGEPRGARSARGDRDYGADPDHVARPLAPDGAPPGPDVKRSIFQGCCGCGALLLVVSMALSGIASFFDRFFDAPTGGEDLVAASIHARHWERAVVVEQRRLTDGDGWELPDSAQVVRRRRRFHHDDQETIGYRTERRQVPRTERIPDGTETRYREVEERVRTGTREYVCGQRDLGNGYFEDVECEEPVYETRTRREPYEEARYREETRWETVTDRVPITRPVPVYRTYYTWRVPRWEPVDTLRLRGDDTDPAWPDTTLRRTQRWGERTERYALTLRQAGGSRRRVEVALSEWLMYSPGQRVSLRTTDEHDRVRTLILPADSLAACRRWHMGRDDDPPADSLGCSPKRPGAKR